MATQHVTEWRGQELLDNDGDKIGTIEEIYLDTDTDRPEWALVKTGLFGGKGTFVPLQQADPTPAGVQVPFEKSHVKDAPNVDPDGAALAVGGADPVPTLRPRLRRLAVRPRRCRPRHLGPDDGRRDDALRGGAQGRNSAA